LLTESSIAWDIAQPWISHPLWQQLAVVQAGNAHAVSDAVWTTAGGIQAAHLLLDDLEQHLPLQTRR
jgi:iron complex transport system substrate-binding protein